MTTRGAPLPAIRGRAWSSGTEDGSHGSVDSIVAQGADAVVDGLDCSGG